MDLQVVTIFDRVCDLVMCCSCGLVAIGYLVRPRHQKRELLYPADGRGGRSASNWVTLSKKGKSCAYLASIAVITIYVGCSNESDK